MNDTWRHPSLTGRSVEGRLSKADLVYVTLRTDIITLAIPPGTAIDKQTLCRRLDVSRFPVSDALTRLAREGLVLIEPQRGSFAARLDPLMLGSAAFMRSAIETEACRRVAARAGPALIGRLRESLGRQREALAAEDLEALQSEDAAFHASIVAELGLPSVLSADDVASAHLERLRRLTFTAVRRFDLIAEHEAIVDALVAGDGPRAGEAMRSHLAHIQAALDTLLTTRPDLFTS